MAKEKSLVNGDAVSDADKTGSDDYDPAQDFASVSSKVNSKKGDLPSMPQALMASGMHILSLNIVSNADLVQYKTSSSGT